MQCGPPQTGGYVNQNGPWPPRRFQDQAREKGNYFHCAQPGHFQDKCTWKITRPPQIRMFLVQQPPPKTNDTN